ncbi:PREDICTED: plant intracellular Ras-group-related LRR protein 9-like, partial [Prunus mume]|uniref:Plant intracellular Ras-group-related LRR protein 9-like n=1 Tax=Prunus mume TaxID=102107 RepID=A0ABM1LHK8_PRUMU
HAISDVSQTCSILKTLGYRPDHEVVNVSKARLTVIDSNLAKKLEELILTPRLALGVVVEDDKVGDEGFTSDQVHEEVVGILQEASGIELDKVNLSGRQLRFLPEAFGRIHDLLMLDLSNNELQVIPNSIARLEKLEELNLSSNLLEALPDSIGMLQNLSWSIWVLS